MNSARRGARCAFDDEHGDPPVEFVQLGVNVTVLEPGETGPYHAEQNQEAFLVLSGSARCSSRARSDACGPGSSSMPLSGQSTSEEPCVTLSGGCAFGPGSEFPASELAARYEASVA